VALSPGVRLGPYEILDALGAGGMGEVYRARDTRLGRDVAVKILPAEFSADPVRRQRFEREAIRIASAIMIWPPPSCRNSFRCFGPFEAQFSPVLSQQSPRAVVK